jgi:hypothetical protein
MTAANGPNAATAMPLSTNRSRIRAIAEIVGQRDLAPGVAPRDQPKRLRSLGRICSA